MMVDVRVSIIRVHNALRPSCGLLSRICRVRLLFPDIGKVPVLFDMAFERYRPVEEVTDFPAADQVLEHLAGLTMFQR